MDRQRFQEQMLAVMERKTHWAWPAFTSGRVPKDRLHYHFEQEYGTYVRDFPVMVGRAYVRCPIPDIRRSLAENLYEEETGGLVAGSPHALLFLEYPRGLGMDLTRFEHVELLPAAQRYRNFLDEATQHYGWDIATDLMKLVDAIFAKKDFEAPGLAGGKGSIAANKPWLGSNVQQIVVTTNPDGFKAGTTAGANGLYNGKCPSPLGCWRIVPNSTAPLTYKLS